MTKKKESIFICSCNFRTKKVYEMLTHINEVHKHNNKKKEELINFYKSEHEKINAEFNKNMLITFIFFGALILLILSVQLFLIAR